jgi:hypothetical protein
MENSPPGIQTIPSGAGFGAGEEFATVATKPDDGDGVAICCAEISKPSNALSASVTKRMVFIFGRSAEIESLLALRGTLPQPRVLRKRELRSIVLVFEPERDKPNSCPTYEAREREE